MSPLLDSPSTEKSARTRTDATTTLGPFRGTDGSNPLSSSGELGELLACTKIKAHPPVIA
jgi:hypothetical protein